MAAWNSRGLRGSTFEELINQTNEQYEQMNLALIQKIPTPITPVKIDQIRFLLQMSMNIRLSLCKSLKNREELLFC